jgi:Uma2 family endonuclease
LIVHGISWEQYEAACELFGDTGVRLTYLEGTLELMSPLRLHEHAKKLIARLVEAYAMERGLPLQGYGSTTFRKRAKERGVEPDECYMLGEAVELDDRATPPHIALEVQLTHSDIDKHAVYAGLGVRELWLWDGSRFQLHVLDTDRYRTVSRSPSLPHLDFDVLGQYALERDQAKAVRAFVDGLRAAEREGG